MGKKWRGIAADFMGIWHCPGDCVEPMSGQFTPVISAFVRVHIVRVHIVRVHIVSPICVTLMRGGVRANAGTAAMPRYI